MTIYFFITLITSILYFLTSKYYNQKNIFYFFFSLFLIIPTTIEGLRDLTVGKDLLIYGYKYYDYASYSPNLAYLLSIWRTTEYGYISLNYICSKIYNNIYFFLIINAFIKILLVGITAIKLKNRFVGTLFVTTYMLFFYWYGFSLMRQNLALCFGFISMFYFFEKKYKKYLILLLVAYSFHNSAILLIILPINSYIYNKFKSPIYISTISCIGLYFISNFIIQIIVSIGIVRSDFSELYSNSGVPIAKTNILICLFILFISTHTKISKELKYWLTSCSIISIFFLLLATQFEIAFRISFYPMLILLTFTPLAINSTRTNKYVFTLLYICLFLIHTYISIRNEGEFQYSSLLLNTFL